MQVAVLLALLAPYVATATNQAASKACRDSPACSHAVQGVNTAIGFANAPTGGGIAAPRWVWAFAAIAVGILVYSFWPAEDGVAPLARGLSSVDGPLP